MERRRSERIKRRIPCAFRVGDDEHRGIVVDASEHGVFLETRAHSLAKGARLTVELDDGRFPGVQVDARVVRVFKAPTFSTGLINSGVGLEWIDPPAAYLRAIGELVQGEGSTLDPVDASTDDVAIELDIDPALEGVPEIEPLDETPTAATPAASDEPPCAPDVLVETPDADAASDDVLDDEGAAAMLAAISAQFAGGEALELEADALLVDQGELDDVDALLEEIGADTLRVAPREAERLGTFQKTPRAIIVAATSALRASPALQQLISEIPSVAIAEGDSNSVVSLMRRNGFDFVVRRPVDPDALRLLLTRVIYCGTERRRLQRTPIGADVAYQTGFWKKPAMLLEISKRGASLLTEEEVPRGTRMTVRIPRRVTGAKPLGVIGRVRWIERRRRPRSDGRVRIGIAFEDLPTKTAGRLDELLNARAHGPVSLPKPRETEPVPAAEVEADGRVDAELVLEDRRDGERVPLRTPLLVLEDAEQHVQRVLFANELSPGGMVVDPHPDLVEGEKLWFAVHPSEDEAAEAPDAPLRIEAEVLRDDGERGLVLRFVDPTDADRTTLRAFCDAYGALDPAEVALDGDPFADFALTEEDGPHD